MGRIAFLHPDLGIGGAERLIIDAALALQNAGHQVTIFTSHHDINHCFPETKTELEVISAGDWMPCSTLGKCKAIWAYLRMLFLTHYFLWYHCDAYDVVVCDLIPIGLPALRWKGKKCIFYCHFPDQLLTKKETLIKKIYRLPIDWIEGFTIAYSHIILVNSLFTQEIFQKTFSRLNLNTQVLYPTVNFSVFDKKITGELDLPKLKKADTIFLSINRYERKKNLELAIESLCELYNANQSMSKESVHLIVAGGYDPLNCENIEYHQELIELASKLQIEDYVSFLKSPSDEQKQLLLHSCTAVIYTPENEHFGIVPLEAMYMRRPVIATNTGGPRETVNDGETGYLCPTNVTAFAEAMNKLSKDKSLGREMGIRGHERVTKKFNFKVFQSQLCAVVNSLISGK